MPQFDYEKVKNPLIFKENTLEAHSDHICYASLEELEEGTSSFRHSLDGLWKFAYARNYDSAIQGFEALEYDCKSWGISEFRLTSRWKAMTAPNMPMYSILGMEESRLSQEKSLPFLIRLQVM